MCCQWRVHGCDEGWGAPVIVCVVLQVALARGAQVVVLGSASEPEVHNMFERMAAEYGTGGDARFVLRYDEGLAHR